MAYKNYYSSSKVFSLSTKASKRFRNTNSVFGRTINIAQFRLSFFYSMHRNHRHSIHKCVYIYYLTYIPIFHRQRDISILTIYTHTSMCAHIHRGNYHGYSNSTGKYYTTFKGLNYTKFREEIWLQAYLKCSMDYL